MIKEIIFDCFGVLTQDGWSAFLRKFGNSTINQELHDLNHQSDRGIISYQEFLKRVSELTTVSEQEAHNIITENLHPNEPVFEIVKKLKKHYQVGVISNVGGGLETYLPADYIGYFDVVTLSSELGYLKPEPEIYLQHLAVSGSKPEEAIFIDDRERNIQGARAVGMQGIIFKNHDQLCEELRALNVKLQS